MAVQLTRVAGLEMKVDRGWAWVVCAAAFLTHLLTVGFSYGISVYYVEFLDIFNESKGTTAWLSSLNYGVLCGIGPVASVIIFNWGLRVTMFTGGVLAALGLFLCAFATQFYVVLLTFGFITGLGSGLAYTAATFAISVYFVKLRPVALGLSLAGGSAGNVLFPWITTALIDALGWRGALMISSGLVLHICVAAMLLLELPEAPKDTRRVTIKVRRRLESVKRKIVHETSTEKTACGADKKAYQADPNDPQNVIVPYKNNTQGKDAKRDRRTSGKGRYGSNEEPKAKEQNIIGSHQRLTREEIVKKDNTTSGKGKYGSSEELKVKEQDEIGLHQNNTQEQSVRKDNTTSGKGKYGLGEKLKLKEQESKPGMLEQSKELFSNLYFVLLMVNTVLFLAGSAVVFTHILSFVESEGASESLGNAMVSLLGVSGLAGKVGLGMLAQLKWMNTLVLYIVAVSVSGLATLALAFWTSTAGMFVCTSVLGFFIASFGPTMMECAFLITGPRTFTFANGYLLIFSGVGWLIGAPTAGIMYDVTEHYPNSFYLGGGTIIAGALVLVPVAIFLKKEHFPGKYVDPAKTENLLNSIVGAGTMYMILAARNAPDNADRQQTERSGLIAK